MWRVRAVIKLLLIYFLWWVVYSQSNDFFGYQKSAMLTYILGVSVIQSLVLSSRSSDVSGEISEGALSNYLLKPFSYFRYWLTRDAADKLLNLVFVVLEIILFIFLFKPPLVISFSFVTIILTLLAVFFAILLYFYLSFLISMTTFWYLEYNGWPARFLFTVMLEFVAGGLFPLDIFPSKIYTVISFLPTTYLLFFPMQILLGRVSESELFTGIAIMIFWVWLLKMLVKKVWQKGIKVYESAGR